jgi:glycosyltransferase involved in cell wall biosynthesis
MGGVASYTLHLAGALQKLGHEVSILTGEPVTTGNDAVAVIEDSYEEIPVTRLEYDFNHRPTTYRASYSDPLITTQFKAQLQKLKPDIVHATSLSLMMAGLIEAASTLDLPLIYTATDFVLTCRRGIYLKPDNTICGEKETPALCTACMGPQTPVEKYLNTMWKFSPKILARPGLSLAEKIIGKKADFVHAEASITHRFNYLPYWRQQINFIIAPSTYMRDKFVLNGFPAERIKVFPYGSLLPTSDFKKIPAAKLRFGFIGRIIPIKGVHLLLDAFTRLPSQAPVELTLYGSPEAKSDAYFQDLQAKSASFSHIRFAGPVPNSQITQLYRQIDVLVAPSIWPENSPVTILEAQAHGTPVIASNVGGIMDLIQHERNGLIFANQDVDDLARQVSRCLTEPGLVAKLSSQSRIIRSIEEDAQDLVELYQHLSSNFA